MHSERKVLRKGLSAGLGGLLAAGVALALPLAGAIFTTTPDGSIVNENVRYDSKLEVYLDGGPGPNAPQGAAGLPDGLYVFQVTNPSGSVLLSEDPAKCRMVEIAAAVITRLVPPSDFELDGFYTVGNGANQQTLPCHIQDDPDGAAGTSGHHDTNTDTDHGPPAVVVQLMPFLDTPNPGGVYKAWMMPLQRYLQNGGDLTTIPNDRGVERLKGQVLGFTRDPGFGPPRDQTKTDNFKVREKPPLLHVHKFHDTNANGIWDAGEPEIGVDQCVDTNGDLTSCDAGGGWPVRITEPVDGGTVTNDRFTPVWEEVAPGTVRVEEDLFAGKWTQSHLSLDGTVIAPPTAGLDVTFTGSQDDHTVVFGNFQPAAIHGVKFEDLNGNGMHDPGEPGLAGVTIQLTGTDGMGNLVEAVTSTDAEGQFWFMGLAPGIYTVSETVPEGSVASTPIASGPFALASGDDLTLGFVFGNFRPVSVHAEKFFDLNENGVKDGLEAAIADVEFCLTDASGSPVTQDVFGNALSSCQTTDANGMVWWMGLRPGTYTVTESLPAGFFNTTPLSQGAALLSGESTTFAFGNVANCAGLTPGYWRNWRNHYTEAQFQILIQGTIASSVAAADAIFVHWEASPEQELTILRAMLLSNQLTLNLTQHPELPNPSGGNLFNACQLEDIPDTLGAWITRALEIHNADGSGFTRDEILAVAMVLDKFANAKAD